MIANLFFLTIFPSTSNTRNIAATVLQVLVALSSLGSVIAATISASRIIRESGRQGLLPYPEIWASTKPFNTPLAAYLLRWSVTSILIVVPPPGDAFNFSKVDHALVITLVLNMYLSLYSRRSAILP